MKGSLLLVAAGAIIGGLTVAAGEPGPVSLEVNPDRVVLRGLGQSMRLLVTGLYADGSRRDLSREATFESSDESLVRVSSAGGTVEQVFAHTSDEAYDLVRDFSLRKTPQGPFRYERGDRPEALATLTSNFVGGAKDFPALNQPGFQANPGDMVPGIARAIDPAASGTPHDLPEGCVFGHGPLRIVWTAPRNGAVDILGSAWMPRDIGRFMFLSLRMVHGTPDGKPEETVFFNEVSLPVRDADRDGVEEGPTSRRPFAFEEAAARGGRDPSRLRGVSVRAGDRILLSALNTDFVGLSFTVAYSACRADGSAAADTLKAEVRVRAGGVEATVPVEVRKRHLPERVSFSTGVLPAISKQGCNQGACHASPSGKGGFRLSLRAYDSAFDYESLVLADQGRRIDLLAPRRSLILKKPLMDVPHGGGQKLRAGELPYQLLSSWIEEGCRRDPPGAPSCVKLEVLPSRRTLRHPDWSQQLLALAHFSDGSVKDVTRLAIFTNSDENVARVEEGGLVEGQEPGEAAIMARFLDKVETVQLAFLRPVPGYRWSAPPADHYIDRLVYKKLEEFQIPPSEPATDGEFLRRVYLDLLGLLPKKADTEAFLAEGDSRGDSRGNFRKRGRIVDWLLERPEHAEFWALRWGDLLRVEKKKITPAGMHRFHRWLVAAWAENMPYDKFVREILTARGSTFENPPANYYRSAADVNDYLESSSLLFLGTRMQCAKCHNHPFERWTQDNYYGLASFFSRVKLKPGNRADELVVWSSPQGEVTHARTGKPAKPWLPLAGELTNTGERDRRELFADWLARPDNAFFARVEANRLWGYLFGRGIVEPVDDFRDSNPPSNAALLDALAEDFIRSGFDRRYLLKTILSSRTYQASSRENELNRRDDRYFSHARTRLLSAEQLLDAVCHLTGVEERFEGLPPGLHATQLPGPDPDQEFLRMFGQPERDSVCQCERSNDFSLSQALLLINGALVQGKLRREDNLPRKLAAAGRTDRQIVEELYLSALCRAPSPEELQSALEHVAGRPERLRGLEDIVWAMLNTKEFLFQH